MPSIRINDDNYNLIKFFRELWGLSTNDIISIAMEALTGVIQEKGLSFEAPVYKLQIKPKRINTNNNRLCELLSRGYDVFIPSLLWRQASYLCKKLKNMGFNVTFLKAVADGESGIVFLNNSRMQINENNNSRM